MFGLYRNPFSHHPCVRSAVDSTANTNIVFGPEVCAAYQVEPTTLDTLGCDPYANQITSQAKSVGTLDVAIWSLDNDGKKTHEELLKQPWCGFIHDCVVTKNFLVTTTWPFEATIERMKAGSHHWAYYYSKAVTFIVVRGHGHWPVGWREGETRHYPWKVGCKVSKPSLKLVTRACDNATTGPHGSNHIADDKKLWVSLRRSLNIEDYRIIGGYTATQYGVAAHRAPSPICWVTLADLQLLARCGYTDAQSAMLMDLYSYTKLSSNSLDESVSNRAPKLWGYSHIAEVFITAGVLLLLPHCPCSKQ
ncbi:hypothetical protein P389DRAFT_182302 [Cystobasidium minutum MCA 4210]|uniref:uncharacterized protein n=1 Tax=Cystobasidium minutum MCA 4210 TaxID=1397322 RepID=UPI0034D00F99|eukprot:jgi/Rhomi1/182302/fgenesh1_pg.13_\